MITPVTGATKNTAPAPPISVNNAITTNITLINSYAGQIAELNNQIGTWRMDLQTEAKASYTPPFPNLPNGLLALTHLRGEPAPVREHERRDDAGGDRGPVRAGDALDATATGFLAGHALSTVLWMLTSAWLLLHGLRAELDETRQAKTRMETLLTEARDTFPLIHLALQGMGQASDTPAEEMTVEDLLEAAVTRTGRWLGTVRAR